MDIGKAENLLGKKFCRLQVVSMERVRRNNGRSEVLWICKCDCGGEAKVNGSSLKSGHTKSCGCLMKERLSEAKLKDITGQRFGRLVVLGRAYKPDKKKRSYWKCKCDCGKETIIRKDSLESGGIKSCGCYFLENICKSGIHGKSNTKLYGVWRGMKDRCNNPNNQNYYNYGGRGIKVCDEWQNDFNAFYEWALENGYDESKTRSEQSLDRIRVDGNYEPDNCRWADKDTQNYNKRETIRVKINDKEMTLKDIHDIYGINYGCLRSRYQRYKKGLLPVEDLIKTEKIIKRPANEILLTVNGETRNLTDWERITGVSRKTIANRYRKGKRTYSELFEKSR